MVTFQVICTSCGRTGQPALLTLHLLSRFISGKGKADPLEAWTGPEGSYEVKIPRFRDKGTGWW